jgi:DNA-binding MarR family transcriptional regulator
MDESLLMILQLLREYDNARMEYHKLLRAGGWQITAPQVGVLRFVALHPGISISQLAESIGIHVTTAEGYAKRLARRGYIHLDTDAGDRRRKVVTVSEDGKRIIQKVPLGYKSLLVFNLLKSGEDEKETIIAGLKLLIKHLKEVR